MIKKPLDAFKKNLRKLRYLWKCLTIFQGYFISLIFLFYTLISTFFGYVFFYFIPINRDVSEGECESSVPGIYKNEKVKYEFSKLTAECKRIRRTNFLDPEVGAVLSKRFEKVKRFVKKCSIGCFICGSTDNTDIHHFYIERSKVGLNNYLKIKNLVLHEKLISDVYLGHYTSAQIQAQRNLILNNNTLELAFINSIFNLVPLCEKHHTGKGTGVHKMPFPQWIAQRFLRKDIISKIENA
jgi:hypothetical protein